ncbi:formate dehydrogenase accessory sulfurtransferase FdhD [Allorhizobium sp. BGMRC 0089]|nr:formate dehydrogenase accessory sulfurtransferase FdhD [Allorhizobium sonneratiae]MCM2293386.1 formate dehydrogenase accessory sulfurtransferase FdhD [Allorhizobium sonneratiae]
MRFQDGVLTPSHRNVPEEVPIAFSYGGSTHAVMMASPADLEDFALGFSLAEGIVRSADEIVAIEPVETDKGIDVQIRLKDATADALVARRRRMAGPVGCGLCGIESIDQAMRPVTAVTDPGWRLTPQMIREAMAELASRQALNHETRAVHAAGFYLAGVEPGLVALREDVGRHNALDKLSGAVLRGGWKGADGMVVVTSRLSVEMVQKTALLGAPVLAAISAPTALAIEVAEASGITLIGIARDRDFEVFVRPDRLDIDRSADRLDVLKRQMNG